MLQPRFGLFESAKASAFLGMKVGHSGRATRVLISGWCIGPHIFGKARLACLSVVSIRRSVCSLPLLGLFPTYVHDALSQRSLLPPKAACAELEQARAGGARLQVRQKALSLTV